MWIGWSLGAEWGWVSVQGVGELRGLDGHPGIMVDRNLTDPRTFLEMVTACKERGKEDLRVR